jgi:hypothetical protein
MNSRYCARLRTGLLVGGTQCQTGRTGFLRVSVAVHLLITSLLLACTLLPARANVYATNVRLNDRTNDLAGASGTNVTISYLLNEPASLGVSVRVVAGTNCFRTLLFTNGQAGTLQGTNTVVWDGRTDDGFLPPTGDYRISVTAASSGYTNWTLITSDTNSGNLVPAPQSITVDKNPSSLYYGRVFITVDGGTATNSGIIKLNADGSPVDNGQIETGGHAWTGSYSPWKIEVSEDDHVYVSDLYTADADYGGEVFRWDPTLASNSLVQVFARNNHLPTDGLSGPYITGRGTNAELWMVDQTYIEPVSRGVLRYGLGTNGICVPGDTGTQIVAPGPANSTNTLNLNPIDIAVDTNGAIYVAQDSLISGGLDYAGPRVLRFPPPSGHQLPETTATWAYGGDATSAGAMGIAVDPTGTYVAAAFMGYFSGEPYPNDYANGNTKILYATNGAVAAELDLNITINNNPVHRDVDCAWDAVGNVYYVDQMTNYPSSGVWRAFSPPGTNQASTMAIQTVHLTRPEPPLANSQFLVVTQAVPLSITLTGSSSDINSMTYSVLAPPTNGSVSGIPPSLTYTSVSNYFGPDQFTFRVGDGQGAFATGQVALVVVKLTPPSTPRLSVQAALNGQASLTLQGDAFELYRIETSQDLAHWTTLTNVVPTNNIFGFLDLDAGLYSQRFYRAALLMSSLQMAKPAFTLDHVVQLSWSADVGRTYQVLASTNLVNWDILTSVPATNSSLLFLDTLAGQFPARFYRARLAP